MKKFVMLLATPVLASGLLLSSGCMMAPSREPTPEERQMALQMQQAFLARLQQAPVNQQVQPQTVQPAASMPTVTEEELQARIEALSSTPTQVDIIRARDGLKFGNQIFLDPEGQIINFGSNARTGDVTYVIRLADDSVAIKYIHASRSAEPVVLATGNHQRGIWTMQTATGKTLSGDRLTPTSRGFVVSRESSAFRYVPGTGIKAVAAPEGYHIALFQNGDVDSTGYILLERDEEEESNNSIAQLAGIASSLSKTVGLKEQDDYVLMHVETGQAVSFDKGIADKEVAVGGTGCKTQSKTLNYQRCDTLLYQESLYRPDGQRNNGHYFWSLFWFNTPDGAFAVAREAGTRKVTFTELATGKKVVLFERTLGINSFQATQSTNGVIQVSAQLGFSTAAIEDAVAIFKNPESNPNVKKIF